MLCTQRVVLQMLATEALTTEGEDGGGIKEAVERAEKRVVLAEDFPPVGGILVAREDHVERALLVVTAVHHVEEQARVRLVEFAVTNLIDNQAGRPDEAGKERALSARAAGDGELVAQLGRLDEVRLHAVAAALVSARLTVSSLKLSPASSRMASKASATRRSSDCVWFVSFIALLSLSR